MTTDASAVARLAGLDQRVAEARDKLSAAQRQARTSVRAIDALREQLAQHLADVERGRESLNKRWVGETERTIAAAQARLQPREHGIAPGSTIQVDVVQERVVEGLAEDLRIAEAERQRFAARHLGELAAEREAGDKAATHRLRDALDEVHSAAAEYASRRAWWVHALHAAARSDLDASLPQIPAGAPRPSQVTVPTPDVSRPRRIGPPASPRVPAALEIEMRRAGDTPFGVTIDDGTRTVVP